MMVYQKIYSDGISKNGQNQMLHLTMQEQFSQYQIFRSTYYISQ